MTPEPHVRINFLTYVPRSGSTLVARLLAETSSIVVVPELALFRDLLLFDDETLQHMSSDELARLIVGGRQFVGLGLTAAETSGVVANATAQGRSGVIESIAEGYGTHVGGAGQNYLLKIGDAINYRDEILSLWPHSKFINVQRDPRAVANSLLNTKRAYTPGESMGRNDPYHCARVWSKHFDVVARFDRSELLTVRYEDFIDNPTAGTAEIAGFLGARSGPTTIRSPFRVAAAEENLHPSYDAPPDPGRASAWIAELSRSGQIVVESVVASRMRKAEYEPMAIVAVGRTDRMRAVVHAYGKHLVETPRWALSRVWETRDDPRMLLVRVRNVIRRRVAR